MAKKYELLLFLNGLIQQQQYERWLHRKAVAHVRRDRKRGNATATIEAYKIAIHKAVAESGGCDFYTGEKLNWSLISTYSNEKSKKDGGRYKAIFALLPTVDHVNDGLGPADFQICSWRTNDAKSDLSQAEFLDLCKKVVRYDENRKP